MKRIRRIPALAAAFLLVFSLSGCSELKTAWEQQQFDTFINNVFAGTMESDYATAHVYLRNPEEFGVDSENIPVNLGSRFTPEVMEQQRADLRELQAAFQEFNRNLLTAQQQDIYDTFENQIDLSVQLSDSKFDYYTQLFQSMTGLHFAIPTFFADLAIYSMQDVEDLIALVQDVKPYVDSALTYTREQAKRGLLMTDLDAVIDYCTGIVEQGENSAVLTAMQASIDALSATEQEKSDCKSRLAQAFRDSFLPAYQAICDTMEELKAMGVNNTGGLAGFENGKEYYALLMRQNIGSDKSVEQVRDMMTTAYGGHMNSLRQLITQNPDVIEPVLTGALPETGYTSYEEILADLEGAITADFPAVSNLNYEIQAVNEEIASDSGVAAYFNIPPLDGGSVQQLRVNPNTGEIGSISTYSTVAHEGFPGHMYQYAYMYENIQSNYVKAVANVPAYSEGYAVYAQYEALDYLDGIDPALLDVYRENELVTYCAIILCDIGIHYDGWSLQEFTDYLNGVGFVIDGEAAAVQYNQLWANPCAFEPYYVGYEEFAGLRQRAEEALGDNFDEKSFHQALLQSGTAPFTVVERNVQAYIDSAA